MCSSCEQVRVNGVVVHEVGCPEAWRSGQRECLWCGHMFTPEYSRQECCSHSCQVIYDGQDCECDECLAVAAVSDLLAEVDSECCVE